MPFAKYNDVAATFKIPNGIVSVGPYAFYKLKIEFPVVGTNEPCIIFPDSLTHICSYAFAETKFESQNNGIETTLQAHLERLHDTFDEKRPIGTILDEWIMNFRDKHPEYVLDSSIQQKDETQVIPYIRSLTLIRLLDIFFDNIIRHSGANQIRIRIQISGADVDVHLSDNGIGIHENVLSESPWYSSLHKADKMLFLLDGRLQMTGSADHGTTIRFSLPY